MEVIEPSYAKQDFSRISRTIRQEYSGKEFHVFGSDDNNTFERKNKSCRNAGSLFATIDTRHSGLIVRKTMRSHSLGTDDVDHVVSAVVLRNRRDVGR